MLYQIPAFIKREHEFRFLAVSAKFVFIYSILKLHSFLISDQFSYRFYQKHLMGSHFLILRSAKLYSHGINSWFIIVMN